jgi:hypothetical protein
MASDDFSFATKEELRLVHETPPGASVIEGTPMPDSHITARRANGKAEDFPVDEPPRRQPEREPEAVKITLWDLVLAEWRTIGMIAAPFVLAIVAVLVPASKGELQTVRTEASSNLDLAKTDIKGQIQVLSGRIDAIQTTTSDTRGDVKELSRDIKRLLERSDPFRPLQAASAPPAPLPLAPPPAAIPAKSHQKRQKTIQTAKPGLLGWFQR